jgi:hypothetical protein
MNLSLWLKDPKTKEPSVSLTLLCLSFVALLVASTFHISGVVENTSSLLELFYANVALYFGRRFSMNGKNFSSDPAPKQEQPLSLF